MEIKKLKRVVIKEELYALTEDTNEAIVLGQLIYWQERVKDYDRFLEEEKARMLQNGEEHDIEKQNGWMYKKASELVSECMLNVSEVTMRRYLQHLVERKFIECRKNPKYKWDKTLQYRVNMEYIISKIRELGYEGLGGYTCLDFQKVDIQLKNEPTYLQNEGIKQQNVAAIPETIYRDYSIEERNNTTINLNEQETKNNISCQKQEIDNFVDEIYKLYPTKCPMRNSSLGKSNKDRDRIKRLLKVYTQEQIRKVVVNEIETKYGKSYMQNFSTFLNNFPDPMLLSPESEGAKEEAKEYVINGVNYQ